MGVDDMRFDKTVSKMIKGLSATFILFHNISEWGFTVCASNYFMEFQRRLSIMPC